MLLVLAAAPLAFGQSPSRTKSETDLLKAPGEATLGKLMTGAEVTVTRVQGDLAEVALEGWIFNSSVGPADRDGYDLVVTRRATENLRQAPNRGMIARLSNGTLLKKIEVRNGWTHVRRTAWVAARSLDAGTGEIAGPAPVAGLGERVEVVHPAPLLSAAEGPPLGDLQAGTQARVLERSGDWVRIALDGWVHETDLKTNDSRVLVGVTQAQVRADPARYTGQVVEWRVQLIAVQKADELRPEMPYGQPYLLTRGPLPEPGFVYVVVSPAQLPRFQAVPPLQELVIRGVVKSAATKYLPNPVLELVSVVKGLGS